MYYLDLENILLEYLDKFHAIMYPYPATNSQLSRLSGSQTWSLLKQPTPL